MRVQPRREGCTTVIEAAERFARRPGFDLVTFREVGLPVYRQPLLTVVMADRQLPALQEFALRAVDAGFETPAAIAEFLGLDERDLDEAPYGLVTEQFLELRAGTNGADPLALTQRGQQTCRRAELRPSSRYSPFALSLNT
jgi:hypothetical protein